MRRLCMALLTLALLLGVLSGCAKPEPKSDARLTVVTTSFPLYDWTRTVLGSTPDAELVWLLDSGVDPHSFQPTVDDLLRLSDCDLFVYVGGESDEWAEDALQEAVNADLLALNLLDALGEAAVEEEDVPGAAPERGEEEEGALDEHIWMSLRNAQVCVDAIADALAQVDPDYADDYRANAADYSEKLAALDAAYAAAVAQSDRHSILVADRFPFRYLAEDYDLDYCAAFSGCSAETEASFQTVLGLADRLNEQRLPVILITESGDERIAEAVRNNAKGETAVRVLDSLQTVTADDAAGGVTYLSVMERNLTVLKEALAWHC